MQIIHRFALSIDRCSELVQSMAVSDASPCISGVLQQKYFKITKPLWVVFVVYWKVDCGIGTNLTYVTTTQPFRSPSYHMKSTWVLIWPSTPTKEVRPLSGEFTYLLRKMQPFLTHWSHCQLFSVHHNSTSHVDQYRWRVRSSTSSCHPSLLVHTP